MKTQYYAVCNIGRMVDGSLCVHEYTKVKTAKEQSDMIAGVALRNSLGAATLQIIPISRDVYKRETGFIKIAFNTAN